MPRKINATREWSDARTVCDDYLCFAFDQSFQICIGLLLSSVADILRRTMRQCLRLGPFLAVQQIALKVCFISL